MPAVRDAGCQHTVVQMICDIGEFGLVASRAPSNHRLVFFRLGTSDKWFGFAACLAIWQRMIKPAARLAFPSGKLAEYC